MTTRDEAARKAALEEVPRAGRRIRLPRRRDGRRRLRRAGGPRQLRRGDQTRLRRSHADSLPDAASPHDAVRDGRDQAPGPRADGLLAAMDSPSHGLGQRIQHAVFGRHRLDADDAPPIEWRTQAESNRQGSGEPLPTRARPTNSTECEQQLQDECRPRLPAAARPRASPASRPARICRCRPTPKPTGRSTCTTCCTFSRCGWTPTPSRKSATTPRRSASRSSRRCFRWCGKRSSTIAASVELTRLDSGVIARLMEAAKIRNAASVR